MCAWTGKTIRLEWLAYLAILGALSLIACGCELMPAPTPVVTSTVIVAPANTMTPAPMTTLEAVSTPPAFTPTPSTQALTVLPQPVSYFAGGSPVELHVMDASADRTVLTDEDGFASLEWSPDGRLGLAVTRAGNEQALYLIDVLAQSARKLLIAESAEQLSFRVAHDWSRALVERSVESGHELWIVDIPGGASRQVTRTSVAFADWRISGDGMWVLAGIEAEGNFVNTLYDLSGAVAYDLESAPHPVAEFSPDGRWLCMVGRSAGDAMAKMRLLDLHNMETAPLTRVIALGERLLPAVTREGLPTSYFSLDGGWAGALVSDAGATKLRVRDLDQGENIDLSLDVGTSLDWMLVYSSLRRVLVATIDPDSGEEALHLWYLDQRVEIPFIEGAATLNLLPEWSNGIAVVDGVLPDGRHLISTADVPNGSNYIVLRGGVSALDLDPQGKRALVALGETGQSLVHLLDLRVGGTLVDMGFSFGGANQPARGEFAPFGQALWARVWRNETTPALMVNGTGAGQAILADQGVEEVLFSSAGTALLYTKMPAFGGGIYLVQADGTGARFLAAGWMPRWHPAS